jgi:hypothetical protein
MVHVALALSGAAVAGTAVPIMPMLTTRAAKAPILVRTRCAPSVSARTPGVRAEAIANSPDW